MFDKDEYKRLKKLAKEFKVTVATRQAFGKYNGVSVVFCKALESADCRMVYVSVSYCAPEDKFSKKTGKFNALQKLLQLDEFVQMPLGRDIEVFGAEEVAEQLLDTFTV